MTALESLKERLLELARNCDQAARAGAITSSVQTLFYEANLLREAAEAIVVSPPAELEQERDDQARVDGERLSERQGLPQRATGEK